MRHDTVLKLIRFATAVLGFVITALQVYILVATQAGPYFLPSEGNALIAGYSVVVLAIASGIVFGTSLRALLFILPLPRGSKFTRFAKWILPEWDYAIHKGSKNYFPWVSMSITALNVFAVCTTIALVLNSTFIGWMVQTVPDRNVNNLLKLIKGAVGADLALLLIYISLLVLSLWWPMTMFSGCAIAIASTLQYLVTIATILFNISKVYSRESEQDTKQVQVYVCLSLILACQGFVGFALTIAVSAQNRLSAQTSKLLNFYTGTCIVSICICIAWLVLSTAALIDYDNTSSSVPTGVERANPAFATFGILSGILCIWCTTRLRATPRTKLQVQEYDLLKLTDHELNAWATLIDTFNSKNSADAAKGKEALDLMIAYVSSPMPGFRCKVLRVFDNNIADIEKQAIRSYDEIKAWETLDDVSVFCDPSEDAISIATTCIPTSPPEKLISKNALKKAQKKAQKKKKTKDIVIPDFHEKSREEIEREQQFRVDLLSTEGLILLTTIDNYDLTGPLKGMFGKFLRHTLGSKSWFKPLCVRFGILGTHWPFRQMVFYTAPTKKPTARNAALLASVSSWNDRLPSSQRCSLMYNPCYGSTNNEKALGMSGWTNTRGAPSHVIDLRPFTGVTLTEYLKAIKYRNQANIFKSAQGEVIETDDFSPENCAIAMKLWVNIAEKRIADGHTAVLKDPNAEFLESLGKGGNGYRKLLFLKVNGEVIASCVLFFLGSTLTSDMQGLDHEKARQYKAYFVMMQETIAIALRDGISFVDFGPSTAKPKLDIGCSEIPLLGGVMAKKPLATIIGLFADQIDV